jgi:hypothetical protein
MPRPYASGVVPASAEDVWKLVSQFVGLADWHPLISESFIESGTPQQVGTVRRLILADGSQVAERLLALDSDGRSYTYTFDDAGNMPVRSYKSTIRVASITSTNQSFVEWWAWFDSDADAEEKMAATFADAVFGAGIAALAEIFSK